MDQGELLDDLFDTKKIHVLKFFLANPGKQLYLKEISDNVNVPIASTHRILKLLVKLDIIIETNISKFKVYVLAENEKVNFLSSFIKETKKVIEMFVDQIKNIPGIKQVILHGKEDQNRANILLIGESINLSRIKEIVGDLKEQQNFNITHMTLTEEQYEQMSSMGLYSGQKKILLNVEK